MTNRHKRRIRFRLWLEDTLPDLLLLGCFVVLLSAAAFFSLINCGVEP